MQLAAKETLRCADIVEEMFVNLHECIDKKGKNIENELKSARTLQKHYVLCGIARIGILSDDINGEVNIAYGKSFEGTCGAACRGGKKASSGRQKETP